MAHGGLSQKVSLEGRPDRARRRIARTARRCVPPRATWRRRRPRQALLVSVHQLLPSDHRRIGGIGRGLGLGVEAGARLHDHDQAIAAAVDLHLLDAGRADAAHDRFGNGARPMMRLVSRDQGRVVLQVEDQHPARHAALSAITFWRWTPRPSMPSSIRSPALRYCGGFCPMPTPGGVPVEMTSPGMRLMNWLR